MSLSGCVTGPRHYAQDESRALNLARAGGIYDLDLRDSHDGVHSYSKGMLVPLLGLARLSDVNCKLPHNTLEQKVL